MARASRQTAALVTLTLVAGAMVATGGAGAAVAAAEPVAGGLTSGDTLFPNQGNSGYDALHYDLDLTVDVAISSTSAAPSVTTFPDATASIKAVTTGAPLSSYAFDFQGSATTLAASTLNVTSVTVNGAPATFSRIENTTTANATTDVHKLIVTPATPVDGEFTTVVKYSGTPVRHTDTDGSYEGWNNTTDGATFVNQPVGAMTAYPNNNTPNDKATYTISVNAPSKLGTSATAIASNPGIKDAAVASNGELIAKTPNADGSRTTWVWDQKKPMATMATMISVGRYDVYEADITLASGRTLHEWTFIDPAISVTNQQTTQATRGQLKSIVDFLETKYGPYPGNSLGFVTDVVPTAINYALETQDRSFFPNSASRSTTIHELTHQWFGDGISPKVWNDIWISEGTATYSEAMTAFESAGSTTTSPEQSYYTTWNNSSPTASMWTVPTAAMTQASQLFGTQVYTRGAMTLEALRTAIGADKFTQLMAEWNARYAGSSRTTADFIALAEEVSGRSLTAFFTPWLYGNTKAQWPSKFNLTLTGPTAPLNVGDTGTYTLSSRNTGKVPQTGSVVTVDLSKVLDKATLGELPANTTLSDTTLTWTVPTTALAATSTVSFTVVPNTGTTGATLSAVARASTLGSTCIDCSPSLVIGSESVSPSAVPVITGGTPTVGSPLVATTDGWPAGTTFAYQWLVDGSVIPGATSATYTPDGTSVGFSLAVRVTGSKGDLTPVTTTSAATPAVVRAVLTSGTPLVVGTPQFGKPLTVDPGTWTPGTFFTYQWAANGASISGATSATYTPAVATQLGQTLTVTVSGTKFGYVTATKTSAPSAAVVGNEFSLSPVPLVTNGPRALSAASTSAIGTWDDGTNFTYQWLVNGAPVATTATFTPTIAQIGSTLTVTVNATKAGYTPVSRTSLPVTIDVATQVLQPTPAVTGTAKYGSVLTATTGTWDAGTSLALQWSVAGEQIEGATASTFTPTIDMIGKTVTVAVTSTRPNYAPVTKTSVATAAVAPADLVLTPVPTIAGTPKVAVELSATPGDWDEDVAFSYVWNAAGTPVEGATGATFTPGAAQAGLAISVTVTGTKTGFAPVSTTSLVTEEVALGDLVETPVPTITGTPRVGVELTAIAGSWDLGTALSYQWFSDDEAVEGAIQSTFTPGPAKVHSVITVEVTGIRAGYESVTRVSVGTASVAPSDLVTTPIPTITGTPRVGLLLTALPGTWDAATEFSYAWYADGVLIEGAESSEYVPTAEVVGDRISVAVTGSKLGHNPVTKSSILTAVVAVGKLVATPKPYVTGVARVGRTVDAGSGVWDEGTTLSYKWLRNGKAITGQTGSTYTLSAKDYHRYITVVVTGKKPGYTSVVKTSPTRLIFRGYMTLQPRPVITGDVTVGQVLRIDAVYDAGVSKSYSWYANGKKVSTKSYVKLTKAMKGKTITVKVTVRKSGYQTISSTSVKTAKVS